MKNKVLGKKLIHERIWRSKNFVVAYGELKRRGKGNVSKAMLCKVIGEKIPYEALGKIKKHCTKHKSNTHGVYVAHDSMGCARYVGRGDVFGRLGECQKKHKYELVYFSFYIVENRQSAREIETLLIHTAGPLLEFNDKKKRSGMTPGNVYDHEVGTFFYERQNKKGPS